MSDDWSQWTVRILAILGGLFLLWELYGLLAPEPEDRLPEAVERPEEGAIDLVGTLAAHLGTTPVRGNHVELLVNGDEIFPPMLDAIRRAERSIDLLTYVYWTGDIAREFAEALSDASRRGVRVRVLLDAFGAGKMRDELVEAMESAGVAIAWFHPLRWYDIGRYNHRTHRKVLVVDDTVGFTGGVGIAEEWTGDAEDPDHWRDDHFRLTGPVVSSLKGAFAENWLDATGEVLVRAAAGVPEPWTITGPGSGPDPPGPARGEGGSRPGSGGQPASGDVQDGTLAAGGTATIPEAGTATVVPVFTSPGDGMSPIGLAYWTAFRTARDRIDIATPYYLPDPTLGEALAAAARRGVRVRLLVPGEYTDAAIVRRASYTRYERLLEAGVEIWEFQPTMMHSKTVVVDDRLSVIGSANFDNRSFELNDEVVLLVDDPGLNEAIVRTFEEDLGRSRRVDLQTFRDRPWWSRVVERLSVTLREQL